MKSSFALAPAPWQQWMGAFVVEVSVRPCELPLAFDAFSQTYQALPRQEGDLLWIRLWFESCTARAEPCQLAVWRVKMCSLKGSDVFFVRPLCARSKEEEEVQCKRGNFCLFHNKIDTCFLYRHAKSHMVLTGRGERRPRLRCNVYVAGRALTSKTVRSPRRCSRSRATCTLRDRTGGESLHFLHVVNWKR